MKTELVILLLGLSVSDSIVAQGTAPAAAPTAATGSQGSSASAPAATPVPPPSAPAKLSAAELEKLAMPIALHPDPLVSIILPAAAYPLEIVQAARFVKDTNNVAKVDQQPWDENVKAGVPKGPLSAHGEGREQDESLRPGPVLANLTRLR